MQNIRNNSRGNYTKCYIDGALLNWNNPCYLLFSGFAKRTSLVVGRHGRNLNLGFS